MSAIDDEFSPRTATVSAGETVTWSNDGDNVHTVTSDDGVFDSGLIDAGTGFSFTFAEPGTYPYYCQVHGAAGGVGMAGTIVVAGAAGQPAEPEEGAETIPPRGLPSTGAAVGLWLATALSAIGVGAGVLVGVRGK